MTLTVGGKDAHLPYCLLKGRGWGGDEVISDGDGRTSNHAWRLELSRRVFSDLYTNSGICTPVSTSVPDPTSSYIVGLYTCTETMALNGYIHICIIWQESSNWSSNYCLG